jgi:hypothetical protein
MKLGWLIPQATKAKVATDDFSDRHLTLAFQCLC